jgi:hypothetical protein
MEVITIQLQIMLQDAGQRGYARKRIDAADDVGVGAALLTSSSRALTFLHKRALGSVRPPTKHPV